MIKALLVPELRELLESNDLTTIKSVLEGLHPAAAAELLSGLESEEIVHVLPSLDIHFQADVFGRFEMPLQVELVEDQGRRPVARLLEEMSPDDRADLVQALDEEVQRELLPLLAQAERADIRRLVAYPEDTVGAVMTTDYATLPEDITAGEALQRLRTVAPDAETIYYIYVTDAERRLKGVFSLKTLILARPERRIGELMTTDVISVRAEDDEETVAQEIAKYDWLAMPVVDQTSRLVGLVTVDDVIDVIEDEADEDIYHLGAAGKPLEGYFQVNPFRMAGQRLPWLLLLVFVGFISATMLGRYEEFLKMYGLFIFIPMVLGSGGNAGSQTVAVIVRGLATGELETGDVFSIMRKEVTIAAMVGLTLGAVAVGLVYILSHNPYQAATVGLAIVAALLVAKSLGGLLPLGFQKIGLDPALMSAPLITTILDVVAVGVYLLLAKSIMSMAPPVA